MSRGILSSNGGTRPAWGWDGRQFGRERQKFSLNCQEVFYRLTVGPAPLRGWDGRQFGREKQKTP